MFQIPWDLGAIFNLQFPFSFHRQTHAASNGLKGALAVTKWNLQDTHKKSGQAMRRKYHSCPRWNSLAVSTQQTPNSCSKPVWFQVSLLQPLLCSSITKKILGMCPAREGPALGGMVTLNATFLWRLGTGMQKPHFLWILFVYLQKHYINLLLNAFGTQ